MSTCPSICRTVLWALVIAALGIHSVAQSHETILHVFLANPAENPMTTFITDGMNNLYGTTFYDSIYGAGTVYELLPASGGGWTYKVLHVFTKGDGCYPEGKLVMDAHGSLYGTTFDGGAHACGTVYRLRRTADSRWLEENLHDFGGGDCFSTGGLAMDKQGNLYGALTMGGKYNSGVAFQLRRSSNGKWAYRRLHSFGPAEPYPATGLLFDRAGSLYGGDQTGIFSLERQRSGWTENIAHTFDKKTEGYNPSGDLLFDKQGNLYGTTSSGGEDHAGAAYVLSKDAQGKWKINVLHSFDADKGDGTAPLSGLALSPQGDLYGTTSTGGAYNKGTVYRLSRGPKGWRETILHSFSGGKDGNGPVAGIFVEPSGSLLGSTYYGGSKQLGVVFELSEK